jgi:hypothetical protein
MQTEVPESGGADCARLWRVPLPTGSGELVLVIIEEICVEHWQSSRFAGAGLVIATAP